MKRETFFPMPWGGMAFSDDQNAGNPFIFLHGTGCDSVDWQETFACLDGGIRTVAVDFRGHGSSDVPQGRFTIEDLADDVWALIEMLGCQRPVFVGHSLGGMVAMALARKREKIGGLVLLEGWSALSCATRAFRGDRMFGSLPSKATAAIRSKSADTKSRFSDLEWQFFWESVKAFDATGFLKATRVPIWEVYGDAGRTNESERLLLVPARGNIFWHWVKGAGHYLPHESPAQVAGICHQALKHVVHGNERRLD
jgi:pimeloyl-ACP methyl ester carboxylesterase